jgi:hypothetical protein
MALAVPAGNSGSERRKSSVTLLMPKRKPDIRDDTGQKRAAWGVAERKMLHSESLRIFAKAGSSGGISGHFHVPVFRQGHFPGAMLPRPLTLCMESPLRSTLWALRTSRP